MYEDQYGEFICGYSGLKGYINQGPAIPVHFRRPPHVSGCFWICNFFGFRPHVSGESGIQIRNFLNPPSRVEIFEWAMNEESCGR